MRTGKLAESVLKRSVFRELHISPEESRSRYGADGALLAQESGYVSVYTTVSAVPGFEDKPGMLVTAAVNNLAASQAQPEALLIHAVLPPDCEEAVLKSSMRQIAQRAQECGMQVIGGHTEVSAQAGRPWFHLTGIGRAPASQVPQRYLQPGDELVMTKWAALAGTAALALQHADELAKRFPHTLIRAAQGFEKGMDISAEARIAGGFGACALHDVSQGGIFGALREMAERACAGLDVDLKKIPIRQETVELCEYFDINPYNFYSAGSLLIGTKEAEGLIAALGAAGVPAAVIGRVTGGRDRIIRNGEDVRYLDRPQQDEWYRRFEP